jgi:hypothetical protein
MDLQGAVFDASVAAVAAVVADRDVAPGQLLEPAVQVRLVPFDCQHVVVAAAREVVGMAALGVHCIGRDDRAGEVDTVQKR